MKIEKNENLSIFLATYWNLSLKNGNLDLFIYFPLKFGEFGHFFIKNPLFRSKSCFSGQNLAKLRPKKNPLFRS